MMNIDAIETLDFKKLEGLLPAIVQDAQTEKVLMLGFMNEEALRQTIDSQRVTFFSRTKNRLWVKGETSGNFLEVEEIIPDCDRDTVLIKAKPQGAVCHTGTDTCFGEINAGNRLIFLDHLAEVIRQRKNDKNSNSYTSRLFEKGINKMAQKVGEEAVEVVIEAKDNSPGLFKNECADLLFHLLILLEAKNFTLGDIIEVLMERHSASQTTP